MLQIKGNTEAVKKEMKHFSEQLKCEIKNLKSEIRELKKDNPNAVEYIVKLENKITDLEDKLHYYSTSKVLPVQIENIIINLKGYQKYLKALEKMDISFEEIIKDSYLIVKHNRGYLELRDLSEHFKGFIFIPSAVLKND